MYDYRQAYREMDEDRLIQLISEFDDLEKDAQRELLEELMGRGRHEQEIWELVGAGRKQRLPLHVLPGTDANLTRRIGNVRSVNGTGRRFYGRGNYSCNEELGYEEWDTTLWIVFLWIPILPRGAFRVRRKLASTQFDRPNTPTLFPGHKFVAIRKLPFRWSENKGKILLAILLFWLPIVIGTIASLRS